MPRSYASDLLVDDFDLGNERAAGHPYRTGRRRSDVFMSALAAAACAAVLANALVLQGGPRSGSSVPAPVATPAELRQVPVPAAAGTSAADTPVPLAPPTAVSADEAVPAGSALVPNPAPTAPLPPVKPAIPPRAAAAAATVASLGALPPSSVPAESAPVANPRPPVAIAEPTVSVRVMEIQKALASIGYGPIHIDGRAGEATRQAIERFERDRRMPVTGNISDRMVRELNLVGGFAIR